MRNKRIATPWNIKNSESRGIEQDFFLCLRWGCNQWPDNYMKKTDTIPVRKMNIFCKCRRYQTSVAPFSSNLCRANKYHGEQSHSIHEKEFQFACCSERWICSNDTQRECPRNPNRCQLQCTMLFKVVWANQNAWATFFPHTPDCRRKTRAKLDRRVCFWAESGAALFST